MARALSVWLRHSPPLAWNEALYDRLAQRLFAHGDVGRLQAHAQGVDFLCDPRDLIQRYIYFFGVWEPHLSAYILPALGPDDLFVDVGANAGYYTVAAAKRCRNVVAMEASPTTFELLAENIRLNGLSNVRALNLAVAGERGKLKLFSGPPGNSGAATTVEERTRNKRTRRLEAVVDAVPIGELLSPEEKRRTRFIKLDIEGGEYPVLMDILRDFSAYGDGAEIVVELSPNQCERHGSSPSGLFDQIERTGLRCYEVRNDYSAHDYTRRVRPERPRRITQFPERPADLILSRRDSEFL